MLTKTGCSGCCLHHGCTSPSLCIHWQYPIQQKSHSYIDGSQQIKRHIWQLYWSHGGFSHSHWHMLAIESAGCILRNTNITWSHTEAALKDRNSSVRGTISAFEGVIKGSWEKEPETGLLCTYTLLQSLGCHLNCELGWEKAVSFSTGRGNDWALWLCKVFLRVALRTSLTLTARMRAVLGTNVQFSKRLGLQGSSSFVCQLRGQVMEIISFQAGIPGGSAEAWEIGWGLG